MITIKVKICGITNLEDAQAAVDMGADVLGFNFYQPSPRFIDPAKAEDIITKLPGCVDTAGVFVNAKDQEIHRFTDSGLLNWIQFHGDETPEVCSRFNHWGVHTIKAIRVSCHEDIERAQEFRTFSLLFDAFDPTLYGGTGKTFDWSLVKTCPRRIFIAGGIGPDNVEKAMDVGVYGVDICSGIESKPGIKDHKKMKQLFDTIHHYIGMKVHT